MKTRDDVTFPIECPSVYAKLPSACTKLVPVCGPAGIAAADRLEGQKDRNDPWDRIGGLSSNIPFARYISPDDIIMIDLSPSQIVEALCRGDIDAGITWESFVYEAKKCMGENVLSWSAQDYQDLFMLLVTRKDVIETKPKAIELFLKSLVEAEEFVRSHGKEVRAIADKRWGREPAYADYIWERIRFAVALDQALIKALEANARAIKRRTGDSAPIPDYLEMIYFDGLDAVDPEAITIFR